MYEVTVRFAFESFTIRDNFVTGLVDRMRNLMPYFTNAVKDILYMNLTQIEYVRFMAWFIETFNSVDCESDFVKIIKDRPEIFYIEGKISIDYRYEVLENN